MRRIYFFVVLLFAVISLVWSTDIHVTPAEQCPGQNHEDLRERIQVEPCGKTRCKLIKGKNTTVNFKFTPEYEIDTLTHYVTGELFGIPLPFVGVHGESACAQVTRADTGEPSPCPLEPGHEYLYTNEIHIYHSYPSVRIRIHWALNDGKRDVFCFEVPASIV